MLVLIIIAVATIAIVVTIMMIVVLHVVTVVLVNNRYEHYEDVICSGHRIMTSIVCGTQADNTLFPCNP